jgi:DNA-binding FadR family transcriptional regulator
MTPELQRFLEKTINSFEKLEIVRRLWKSTSAWRLDDLAEQMGTSRDHVLPALEDLLGNGLVRRAAEAGTFAAASSSVHAVNVEALLASYEEDPLAVLRVINEIALSRIREMAARTFSDSFVVKKPKKPESDDG